MSRPCSCVCISSRRDRFSRFIIYPVDIVNENQLTSFGRRIGRNTSRAPKEETDGGESVEHLLPTVQLAVVVAEEATSDVCDVGSGWSWGLEW